MSIIVRDLEPGDVEAMVRVHRETFPDYFSTSFGPGYLRILYTSFVTAPAGIAVGAFEGDRLAGFAAGHMNWSGTFSRMADRNRLKLGIIACGKMLTSSRFRKGVWSRLNYARLALNPFGRKKRKQAHTSCPNRLVSLAVHPDFRRYKVGSRVCDAFGGRVAARGGKDVGLSVFLENQGAIDFYLRTGWTVETRTEKAVYFVRPLAPAAGSEAR